MSKAAHKAIASHHQIVVRQRTEDVIDSYSRHVKADKAIEFIGKWEGKSLKRVTGTSVVMEMDRIEAEYNDVLTERKRRLANLFALERDVWEYELVASTETETQRRDRIATEALKLRNEREQIRRGVASELLERSFVNACVPLREASSKLMLLKCVSERSKQLHQQHERDQKLQVETEFFEALENKNRQDAETRQHAEIEYRRNKTAHMQRDLATQRTANMTMTERSRQMKQMEDDAFTEHLQQMQQEDADKEAARRMKQREMVAKNKAFNQQQQIDKDLLALKKKEDDRRELQALLDQIKEDERQDQEKKTKVKEDALARRHEQELALRKFADDQSHLDALWTAESDKEWDKLESRRRGEQDQREATLRDVTQGRLEQIRTKRANRLAAKEDIFTQRSEFQSSQSVANRKEAERVADEKSMAWRNQMQLKQQIENRQDARHQTRERKLEETAAGYAAELEFSEKMKHQMERLEAAKPPEFANFQVRGKLV